MMRGRRIPKPHGTPLQHNMPLAVDTAIRMHAIGGKAINIGHVEAVAFKMHVDKGDLVRALRERGFKIKTPKKAD